MLIRSPLLVSVMKLLLPHLLLLFLTNATLAQQAVRFTGDSDTTFWYSFKNDCVQRFKLDRVEDDTMAYSFRFMTFGLAVKVSGNVHQTLGEITLFAEQYSEERTERKKAVYVKRYPISTAKALAVRYLIDSLHMEGLPSGEHIAGWQTGFDGVEYFTEYKKGEAYSFKSYWTPGAQGTLKEALQLQAFIKGLEKLLDLDSIRHEFESRVPFKSWTYPGSIEVSIS